jgi:hypothetical protein
MKKHLKFPSPAMVVALVALGMALGGTAVAGGQLITGAQIRDHSIALKDLTPRTVRALRGQRGVRGPAGLQGSVGPAGPEGLPGTIAPNKVSFQQSPTSTIAAGTVGQAQALCPAGSFVISGGGFTNGQGLWSSSPSTSGTQSGWTIGATAYSSLNSTLTAYAVCLTP